jgi:hypothetical protein
MKAISIHVGLNKVNPAHYGSEARLAGCHNDARDMQKLAKSTGFSAAAPLLDNKATVANVKAALLAAAGSLKAGDSLLVTYSGHGSQVPDANFGSEEADLADETWCLYDRMLLDDELAALWAKFKRGVCITVISDSCHSGTVTRVMPFTPPGAIASGPRARLLPKDCQEHAVRNWEEEYRKIQLQLARKATILISASVILISGCQDDETSLDGDANGLFTGTLLKVWNKGAFKGTLKKLQTEIQQRISQSQNPNYHAIGAVNKTFVAAPALRPVQARF